MLIHKLDNPIQRYAWGSRDGITEALGVPNPGGGYFAELWMGAHPSAPSKTMIDGRLIGLDELIEREPERYLGPRCVARFGGELPFLFKALSAGTPLSIQAHPSKRKAEIGFDRENLGGVPVDAPERNYRDSNSKPEASVALTQLELLCGFRPIGEMLDIVRAIGSSQYSKLFGRLEKNPGRVELSVLFYGLVSAEEPYKLRFLEGVRSRIEQVLECGSAPEGLEPVFRWVLRLMGIFPGDIGALAPIILNLVEIEPGQSVFIAPGELHAYLSGTCLEIMANSDNVIRGALTGKHIDLPELVSVLSFNPERVAPVLPEKTSELEDSYPIFVPDFQVSRIALKPGDAWARRGSGPEILLCARGSASISGPGGELLALERGESAFAAAAAGGFEVSSVGGALLYRASVPELP